ncbi:fasciclin-like arabinogalactan protein 16 [Chenopodium quinoa]|uniref:FAS1 domain-containing protein n=1 Tax=Chenopodium quinoa TaxID=63459 RepID=A0A803MJV5_CHEQI|nr:fasciclin-like arabinogalactan protein 16 [Chenopodium quinoa]
MDASHHHHGLTKFIIFIIFLSFSSAFASINQSNGIGQINSNSILVALLDSSYTELAELVEKALLLQSLEDLVGKSNLTIFAPKNEALERDLNPEFKQFLLEPRNLKSLQSLILHHIVPSTVDLNKRVKSTQKRALSNQHLRFSLRDKRLLVEESVEVIDRNSIVRPDGLIHGIDKLLIPHSVLENFNRRRELRTISAVLPTGAPTVDSRKKTHLKKGSKIGPAGAPPTVPIFDALAPGPSLAPAPAPGPGGPHHHFDGESQVKDFITTLVHYGGYNELADILVNLTSLATEMGRLVSEGYVITVLAPNDEALGRLTADQLSEPGAPEQIMYYHIIPEYQTEESMYSSVRRFGKVSYETLRLPHKVAAEEADGSVRFGSGDGSAYLFDPDIYTDGRISVQGIDGVLFPAEEVKAPAAVKKVVVKQRRGKLLEVACTLAAAFGQDSQFAYCGQ